MYTYLDSCIDVIKPYSYVESIYAIKKKCETKHARLLQLRYYTETSTPCRKITLPGSARVYAVHNLILIN